MEGEQETVPKLSNGTRLNDLFVVFCGLCGLLRPFQGHDIIQRQITGKRYKSYNGRVIESRIERPHFQ